ncbi:MAG: response regulator transcription factor [Propionibacteriaceae bacterium]|nr:MAG: response regulator transcription factor [Propionibacteriaceae bacterium]
MTRVLVVDDEPQILRALRINLQARDYEVVTASSGRGALQAASDEHPDLVVLDLGLPDMDGVEVVRSLRSWSAVPILILSGRLNSEDKVRALDAGADDYVTKPFSVNELIARLRAIFRRAARQTGAAPELLTLGAAQVNLTTHTASGPGGEEQLSFYEVELLRLLAERAGQPVARDEILSKVWGLESSPTNRTVDNFIVKLRKKIERHADKPQHILTVYGFGYKLVT